MRVFNMTCPHCGAGVSFAGSGFDTEMRCMQCGGTFVFKSDLMGTQRVLRTSCPHCGEAVAVCEENFDTALICPKCQQTFGFSRLRGEVTLYPAYAAIIWGVLFGPLIGCWFFKKNFEELNMEEEAAEYKKIVTRYFVWILLTPLWMLVDIFITVLLAGLFGRGAAPPGIIIMYILNGLPYLIGLAMVIGYAKKYGELKGCLTYHVSRSTWPPGLYFLLILPLISLAIGLVFYLEIVIVAALFALIFGSASMF